VQRRVPSRPDRAFASEPLLARRFGRPESSYWRLDAYPASLCLHAWAVSRARYWLGIESGQDRRQPKDGV
jgi:hypothetical protein